MVNSKGYRRGTRYVFAKPFRKHGVEHLTTYLRQYHRGDYVDIKGNGAFQKGMPFKFYHGKTGKVFNVSQRGLGVVVNKRVRNRVMPKRIYIRIEHVKPSRCREEYLKRKADAIVKRKEAREKGVKGRINLKRQPKQPREAHLIKMHKKRPELVEPIPFDYVA